MSQDAMAADGLDIGINGMIRDEPGNRVEFQVEKAQDPDLIEMRLDVVDAITWWKSLSYFMRTGSSTIERYRIETKDATKSARQIIHAPEIVQFGRFELWKAGPFNWGVWVASLDFNSWANRGRRFVFRWLED
jgi:hypothetical protein